MKKKLFFILFLGSILSLSSCDSDDEGFFNSEFLSIPNLVSIGNQNQFNVNEYVYVTATINNLQPIPNSASLLDIRKSTGNATNFDFTYVIEKLEGSDWVPVTITNQDVIVNSGAIFAGDFVTAIAEYDTIEIAYKYNVGIQLKSSGQYRLSFGYNSLDVANAELRSNSTGTNLFLNISSAVANLDGSGFFKFTVN
ncbi:MAG: hypothetical protein ACJAQ1_001168 [Flavobacterium sp.]|jgi:hypothetical protein